MSIDGPKSIFRFNPILYGYHTTRITNCKPYIEKYFTNVDTQ